MNRILQVFWLIAFVTALCAAGTASGQGRKEIIERRTTNSVTYRNPDGSLTTEISAGPMHYQDKNGIYQPIDRTIVPSDTEYDFEVTRGLYHVYFKGDLTSDYPVAFETKDGSYLKMKLLGLAYLDRATKKYHVLQPIQSSKPRIAENKIIYPSVFSGVDIRYIYNDTRLQEEISLSQTARNQLPDPSQFGIASSNAYLVFVTQLDLDRSPDMYAGNSKIQNTEFEGIEPISFCNLKKEVKFFLPANYAFREADKDNLDEEKIVFMHRRLIHTPEGHFLLSGVSLSQLANMPSGSVVFDPEVVVQQGTHEVKDTFIYYRYGLTYPLTENFGITTQLEIWRSYMANWHVKRILIHFDLSAIPNGSTVSHATLGLYCTGVMEGYTTYPAPVNVYKMLTYWDEGTMDGSDGYACWNKPTSSTNWGAAGCQAGVDYRSTKEVQYTIESEAALHTWINFLVTNVTQEWVNDSSTNYGLFIKLGREGESGLYQRFFFASGEWATASQRPKLTVTYTEGSTTPPSAPSNLTATAVSSTQINLSWSDNSTNETGFKIEQKIGSSGTYAQIATVGANVVTYSVSGLSPSTTYYYRVRAYNSYGDSGYSNEAYATTQPGNQPPTVVITSPSNGSQFTVGSTILIRATATDSDGSVAKVEFFEGTNLLNVDTISPYEYTWQSVPEGSYTLTAKATDDDNASTTSVPVTITVSTSSTSGTILYYIRDAQGNVIATYKK